MRGVPRLRRAIVAAPAGSIGLEHARATGDDALIKGEPHESATPWNGTAQWQGRISAVTENGTIELSVGRDKYVTFDAKQAAQLGIDPRKVELNEYVDVYRSNDPDQALRADVAASAAALPQRHADQQIGANR